jgi:hypothetical protein
VQEPIDLMSQYGAYDSSKIYTQDDIKDIVTHANYRGLSNKCRQNKLT